MTEKNIATKIRVYAYNELNEDQKILVDRAREATKGSYSPYSHFHVGAAIRLVDGTIVTGANQENASFPAGTCAERSACFYAGAKYPDVPFSAIAIAAWHDGDFVEAPCAPCGVCRQSLLEYETQGGKPVEVLLVGRDTVYVLDSLRSLLPLAFTEF